MASAPDEIKRMPAKSQITHQACEEGWSFIAECTGVPLSYVLSSVGISAQAKYAVFYAMDGGWDSLDLDTHGTRGFERVQRVLEIRSCPDFCKMMVVVLRDEIEMIHKPERLFKTRM